MPDRTQVLYFEDDVGSQQLVRRVLERHEYDVMIASEGLEGINLARRTKPQLILMDIHLPGMNGREITTRLRGLPNLDHIPIVALTANTSHGHRERALAAGCDGFLAKPINVATFPQEIENFLKGHREKLDQEEKLEHLELHAQQVVAHLEGKIQELEEANRRLRKLDRMKSDFIGLVSHELRTPLTLLEGYSHLLSEQVRTGEEQEYPERLMHLVKGLEGGVGRISAVINEIINVSRITSGRLELSRGPIRIPHLIRDVVAKFAEAAERRQLALEVGDLQGLPLIEADGEQIEVALENIVGNAVKYTPDGGRIEISGRSVGGAIVLIVKDTGIGIPLEEQKRIFDEFYSLEAMKHHSTSKSAFQGGGLGLGLAIAKGIIEAHGGRIWVDSKGRDPNDPPGSSFHLLLPVSPEEDSLG